MARDAEFFLEVSGAHWRLAVRAEAAPRMREQSRDRLCRRSAAALHRPCQPRT